MIASGAFSRHRRGPPGLARRQYPGERGGGMFGVRGAYFAGWITVEIDADMVFLVIAARCGHLA